MVFASLTRALRGKDTERSASAPASAPATASGMAYSIKPQMQTTNGTIALELARFEKLKNAELRLKQLEAEVTAHRACQPLDERILTALGKGDICLLNADFLRHNVQSLPTDGNWKNGLCSRQAMEGLGNPDIFVPNEESQRLIREGRRSVATLTYGWSSPEHADSDRTYLSAMVAFLRSSEGAHVKAVFWDQPCLYQYPREREQEESFRRALKVMGDLYASILGTTVIRHRELPPEPPELRGIVRLRGIPAAVGYDAVYAEMRRLGAFAVAQLPAEDDVTLQSFDVSFADDATASNAIAALRGSPPFDLAGVLYLRGAEKGLGSALADLFGRFTYDAPADDVGNAKGDLCIPAQATPPLDALPATRQAEVRAVEVKLYDESATDVCWRVRFANHAMCVAIMRQDTLALQTVDARLSEMRMRPALMVYKVFNNTAYDERGWPQLETAVGEEGVRRAAFYPRIKQHLDTLPKKFYDIGGRGASPVANEIEAATVDRHRTETVLENIKAAKFTNAADFQMVQHLYRECVPPHPAQARVMLASRRLPCAAHFASGVCSADNSSVGAHFRSVRYAGFIHRAMKNSDEAVQGKYSGEEDEMGQPHGRGEMRYDDGDVYAGEWRDGKQHGSGELRTASGNHYLGQWEYGKRHGEGRQTFSNGGSLYAGQWVNGDPHGTGNMIHFNTLEYTGMFEGEYRYGKREGQGTWQFANGDTYQGRWSSGRVNGSGVYQAHDGYTITASWYRVEHRFARRYHNAPNGGHGLKYMDGRDEPFHWDPSTMVWSERPITAARAAEIQQQHNLPPMLRTPLPSCVYPSKAHLEKWRGMLDDARLAGK